MITYLIHLKGKEFYREQGQGYVSICQSSHSYTDARQGDDGQVLRDGICCEATCLI